ncbi:MAG TPA: 50S ribosomal protein L16 [Candidatus Paceibacterota bacterium]|uniref:50S ribosomal protein L16 n=1 Tax=uncultured Parcubacteria bacterium Rifle_16ft_4_minimus_2958 TaxID=1665137 RepID=A0A0H4T525_9BACT|nr:50S ribosomal protein L16, large subunit ribosomal protein L16 [uncultured Parcubacteria bacterium Rifle_16ft_4_minimus_2958]
MLLPKKVKYRKWHSMRKNKAKFAASTETRGTTLAFGSFGLKAETGARLKSNQIESARKAMAHSLTKAGRAWIRIFPDRPITMKAAEVPMGKGKGDLSAYCFEVKPGRVIFEVDGIDEVTAKEALRKAGTKLPIKTRVISRA